jgi:xanthine/uracil/vitamin C permease (AzgA family)
MVMAYIIFVNPSILGTLVDSAGERLAISAVLTVTCICGVFCVPVV